LQILLLSKNNKFNNIKQEVIIYELVFIESIFGKRTAGCRKD